MPTNTQRAYAIVAQEEAAAFYASSSHEDGEPLLFVDNLRFYRARIQRLAAQRYASARRHMEIYG